MLRILHIVGSMNRGGLESLIMNLYRNIDRKVIQFDFLVHTIDESTYDNEIRKLGGKIFRISSRRSGFIKNRKDLSAFFLNHSEYSIVHQHLSSLSYITPLKYAKKFNVPIRIIHSHNTQHGGSKIHQFLHFLNKKSLSNVATDYFACSDLAGKWLFDNKDFKIINNGIILDRFIFDNNNRKRTRQNFGINNEKLIGHIGKFSEQKNHSFIIDVFHKLLLLDSKCRLLLVGDGELLNNVMKKSKDLGIFENIIFAKQRDDIPDILSAMDIFVMPSLYEGLPVSLIEAQSSDLPCLISDNITKEVFITKKIFSLSLNLSSSVWAEKVLAILNENYDRTNVYKKVNDSGYNIENVASDLSNYYLKATDKNA